MYMDDIRENCYNAIRNVIEMFSFRKEWDEINESGFTNGVGFIKSVLKWSEYNYNLEDKELMLSYIKLSLKLIEDEIAKHPINDMTNKVDNSIDMNNIILDRIKM